MLIHIFYPPMILINFSQRVICLFILQIQQMGTLLTSALVLVICCCSPLFLIVPTNAENAHHRRNPLGFQGVRGKRSATEIPPTSTSYIFASPSSPSEPEEDDERPITPPVATNEEMDYIRWDWMVFFFNGKGLKNRITLSQTSGSKFILP